MTGGGGAGDPAPSPFFTRHARAYAESPGHARGADLARLVDLLGTGPGLQAVDVATGTGHTALALAACGAEVTGVDPTPAMLAEARRLAEEQGLGARCAFVAGTAEALPGGDASADIVTCRRAAHHFSDLPLALRQMRRVLRPGGRLGISDMCPEADVATACNRLEILRDGTHVRALSESEWHAALAEAGLVPVVSELTVEDIALEDWLSPVRPDAPEAEAVRRALAGLGEGERRLLCGGRPGRWLKRRLVLVAVRPEGGVGRVAG